MKNILYLVLLVAAFGSPSLFAVEQFEEKKIDTENPMHENENAGVKGDLKQNLPNQEDKLKSNVDNLSAKDTESKRVTNKDELQHKAPIAEKTISEGFGSDLPEERTNASVDNKEILALPPSASLNENIADLQKDPQADQEKIDVKESNFGSDLPEKRTNASVDNKEILALPPSASLNENIADLQKADQKKIDVKENELPESNPLEEKEEGVETQAEEKKVNNNSKGRNGKNRITKKDNESEQEKNLQKWTKLNREPTKEWDRKDIQSKLVYKRRYDSLNEHLPTTVFVDDYSKQFFYCIKKNNLVCLRGIINKLEKIGLTIKEILRLRNKLGDTPLIYAVKQGGIDTVRFLLLQDADPRVVNNNFQSPLDIAIERKQIDIINVIAEMMPHLLENRKIDNSESSEMYNWAMRTKECDER